jgi:hypothetical protein
MSVLINHYKQSINAKYVLPEQALFFSKLQMRMNWNVVQEDALEC